MMATLPSIAQKDALTASTIGLSSYAQTLLIYLQGLPKGQQVQVRRLMLDSADNPALMRAALEELKTRAFIIISMTGCVAIKDVVMNIPAVQNPSLYSKDCSVNPITKEDSDTVRSQQLNDWLASRMMGVSKPAYQFAAGNNH